MGLNPSGSCCLLCVRKLLTSLSQGLSFHICATGLRNMRQDMRCLARCQAHGKGLRNGAGDAGNEHRLLESSSWPGTWPHRKSDKEFRRELFLLVGNCGQAASACASEH